MAYPIRLEHVTKIFRGSDKPAVDDLTLEIEAGEFLILVGPSGCGKSTTLRMIAGLESPTRGDIYIGEEKVTYVEPQRRGLTMVFQSYALYPHMNVFNNIAFPLRKMDLSKEEIERRVKEATEILDIANLLERKPRELSGGQRQRVAVGRSIVKDPKAFLFDEPLSNLDAKLRVHMRAELSKLQARLGATTIYVTHDQIEAMTMATRLAIMKDGAIQQVGTPQEVYDNPVNKFVAGFIGSPSMNFLKCLLEMRRDGLHSKTSGFDLRPPERLSASLAMYQDQEVILGIRPEDLIDVGGTGGEIDPNLSFSAKVNLIEPLGHTSYLYLQSGDDEIIARIDPETEVSPGSQMRWTMKPENIYFFDKDTEKAILRR